MTSRNLVLAMLGLAGAALVYAFWGLHAPSVQPSGFVVNKLEAGPSAIVSAVPFIPQIKNAPSTKNTFDPRSERKKSTDYRELVNLLLPLARSGSVEAQYEVARALHYCDEELHAYFISRSTGAVRTPEEIRLRGSLPENIQETIDASYQRCHAFLDDLSLLKMSDDWLDQAVKANYPPATFLKARQMLKNDLITGDDTGVEKARDLAVRAASQGADPEMVFGFVDFVTSNSRSPEQYGNLVQAWWLLACESGYDCSAQSDAIRGLCTANPQCANKPTVVEALQLTAGTKFGEVQQLAEQIKNALESRDVEAIIKYL